MAGVVDPVRLGIIVSLGEEDQLTASILARRLGVGHQTLRRHLDALVELGIVRKQSGQTDGFTPGRPPARFNLSPEVQPLGRMLRGVLEDKEEPPGDSRGAT